LQALWQLKVLLVCSFRRYGLSEIDGYCSWQRSDKDTDSETFRNPGVKSFAFDLFIGFTVIRNNKSPLVNNLSLATIVICGSRAKRS
jgi:hypothetical protein